MGAWCVLAAFVVLAGASLAGTAKAEGDNTKSLSKNLDRLDARKARLADSVDSLKGLREARHADFQKSFDKSSRSLLDTHDIRHARAVADREAIKDIRDARDARDHKWVRDFDRFDRHDRLDRLDRLDRFDRFDRFDRLDRFHRHGGFGHHHGFGSFGFHRSVSLDSDFVLALLALGCCRGYGYDSYYGLGYGLGYGGLYGAGYGGISTRTACTAEEVEAARILTSALNQRVTCREAFHVAAVLLEAANALGQTVPRSP